MGIIDGNGATEIVAVCIVTRETVSYKFFFLFQTFLTNLKKHNESACMKIQSCIADKDMVARKILKEMFGIPVYICIWHIMQIFRRTITKDEMNVTKEEREQCLQYIRK